MASSWESVKVGDSSMRLYLSRPEHARQAPAVIVVQGQTGVDDFVKFSDMVTPAAKKITYKIDIKKLLLRKFGIAIADGTMYIDGKPAYECKDMRVGVFPDGLAPATA